MAWIVLAVVLFVAVVIVVDGIRQRRIRASRSIDLRGLALARLVADGPALLTSALRESLARAPSTSADLYLRLADRLDVANLQPWLPVGTELKVFRLRWGNGY